MESHTSLQDTLKQWHGNFSSYVIGLISSMVLTLGSFFLVTYRLLPQIHLFSMILGLGVVQAAIQLIYFLHIGKGPKPRWHLLVFVFMVLTLVIVVAGSIWIMHSLESRLMPHEVTT